jgi:hypothetical protein
VSKPKKEWKTEDMIVAGATGFGLGALVVGIYGSQAIKQINELTQKSSDRQQAFIKDMFTRLGPYATKEDLQALRTHAVFNLMMTHEDGRDIGLD